MLNEQTTDLATIETVLGAENMRLAWKAVKANGGSAGVDGMGITTSERHLRKHWVVIEAKLLSGQYEPGAVRAVEIPKANGGVRTLGIPNGGVEGPRGAISVAPSYEAMIRESVADSYRLHYSHSPARHRRPKKPR